MRHLIFILMVGLVLATLSPGARAGSNTTPPPSAAAASSCAAKPGKPVPKVTVEHEHDQTVYGFFNAPMDPGNNLFSSVGINATTTVDSVAGPNKPVPKVVGLSISVIDQTLGDPYLVASGETADYSLHITDKGADLEFACEIVDDLTLQFVPATVKMHLTASGKPTTTTTTNTDTSTPGVTVVTNEVTTSYSNVTATAQVFSPGNTESPVDYLGNLTPEPAFLAGIILDRTRTITTTVVPRMK